MGLNAQEMQKLYSQLGLVLDGLWFIEVEKKVGFEKAYEIDEAVWRTYSAKEAKRLKTALQIEKISFATIQTLVAHSLFNVTLAYQLMKISDSPLIVRFTVTKCKSFEGMEKMKRPPDQIHRICYGIEIATLEGFFKTIDEKVQIKCVHCPYDNQKIPVNPDGLCAWDLVFSPRS